MPKRGELKPGSLAARLLAMVAEGLGATVARDDLARRLPGKDRCWFARTLASLELAGLITASAGGYRLADARPPEPAIIERIVPPLSEPVRQCLAAIIRRAHLLRERGIVVGAAELLRAAAEKMARHPAAQDLAALADLFEHAPSLYPVLDLPQRAAA